MLPREEKENIKAPRHLPLCGEFTGTGEFSAQMASNAEKSPFEDVIMQSSKHEYVIVITFCYRYIHLT